MGGGSSNNDVAQPVGRKIQASDDGRRGKEERHTRLKLKAAFFLCWRRYGGLYWPVVDPYHVQSSDGAIWPGGTENKCQEKNGDGVPPIPGRRGKVRGSMWLSYDGGGYGIQGATAELSEPTGVWEGLVKGVNWCAPPNPERRDEGGTGSGGRRRRRGQRSQEVHDVFPSKLGPRTYPVEGCSCRTEMRTTMRMHFWHRLIRDTVVIMEEGNLPHARWPLCYILVPWRSLIGLHQCTA